MGRGRGPRSSVATKQLFTPRTSTLTNATGCSDAPTTAPCVCDTLLGILELGLEDYLGVAASAGGHLWQALLRMRATQGCGTRHHHRRRHRRPPPPHSTYRIPPFITVSHS